MKVAGPLCSLLVLSVLGSAIPSAHSQWFGDSPFPENGQGPRMGSWGVLIDDTAVGRHGLAERSSGRFSITLYKDHAILLDSVTGSTWLLTESDKPGQPLFVWSTIAREPADEIDPLETGNGTTPTPPTHKEPVR